MSTFILASIIFLTVGLIIYRYTIKRSNNCDCSGTACPIKNKVINNKK